MRPADIDRKLFTVPHYNIIAKRIRDQLMPYCYAEQANDAGLLSNEYVQVFMAVKVNLVELALSLALRFSADNSEFQAERFLDMCSPDSERYPISELWDNYFIEHKAELFNG